MTRIFTIILLAFALVLSACASTPQGRATQLVVVSDGVADEVATQWDEHAHDRIAKCRAEEHTEKAARAECMGVFYKTKDELEALLKALILAQTAVKLAVKCDSLAECKDDLDWKALEGQLREAVQAIRPILQEIRK